jgi:small conductance mechanosensitive channel
MDLRAFSEWAMQIDQTPQRILWSVLVLALAWLVGRILAGLVRSTARRLTGLSHRRAEADKDDRADAIVLDIVAATIRLACLLGALAVILDLFGLFHIEEARTLAISALKALLIFVGVWFVGSLLARKVRQLGARETGVASANERTLFAFLGSVVQFGAIAVGLIAALQQFGFPTASLVAVVGAAGLAVALALQDTLKAVAGGVIIAIFQPYRLGDFVRIADQLGTVADITPFTTALTTVDNKRIIVTNDKAWGNVIENFTRQETRRLDQVIGISYEDDIGRAISVIDGRLRADPRVRHDLPIWIKVTQLSSSSVDLTYRAWCASGDYFDLKCDMLRAVKEGFDAAGITIPYPHQVAVTREAARAAPVSAPTPFDETGRA